MTVLVIRWLAVLFTLAFAFTCVDIHCMRLLGNQPQRCCATRDRMGLVLFMKMRLHGAWVRFAGVLFAMKSCICSLPHHAHHFHDFFAYALCHWLCIYRRRARSS